MVISTVNQVVYNGDGSTVAWPYTFRIIDATDIKLTIIDADGTETPVSSDYYVDTVNNTVYYPGYAPGAEPPAEDQPPKVQSGQKLLIYRQLPITQEKDLGEKWPFATIELALDKLTMILQQISGWWDRCLKISPADEVEHPGFDMTFPIEAGKSFRVNAEGTGFEVSDDPGIYAPIAIEAANAATAAAEAAAEAAASVELQAVWYDNVASLRSANIPAGITAGTKGYYAPNDGGGGTYVIREADSDTDDGGAIIILDNGNVAQLMIEEDTVLFKQWGAKEDGVTDDTAAVTNAVAYATANGIGYVKCGGTVVTSASIDVAFNFEFDKIVYTGTDHAVVVASVTGKYVKGNKISSDSGGGLLVTNKDRVICKHNIIDILEIVLDNGLAKNAVDILPVNGGIMENRYSFQFLSALGGIGYNVYIPNDLTYYSYVGEEIVTLNRSYANVGVNLEIQPDGGGDWSHIGTITGITFLELSVENSTTGVRIKGGLLNDPNPPAGQVPGIKSIYIHNMRCRETSATTMFLDATGWLSDIQIYPTSGIYAYQWRLITTCYWRTNVCKVVGEILNIGSQVIAVGYNLCSYNGRVFIEFPVSRLYPVGNGNTAITFGDIIKKYKDEGVPEDTDADFSDKKMYLGNYIYGANDVDTVITLTNWDACTLNNIIVSVYKSRSVTLSFPQNNGTVKTLTITNSTADTRHIYRITAFYSPYADDGTTTYRYNVTMIASDLGVGPS
jgi:hypothetical protein